MKKIANQLTNEFHKRKEDRMCLCEKIIHWWKEDIVRHRAWLLNQWFAGCAGGLTVVIIFTIVALIYLYFWR